MRYSKFFKKLSLSSLMVLLLCCLLYIEAQAAQEEKVEKKTEGMVVAQENKKVNGTIGAINSKFIAIIDESDKDAGYEHETLYYLDENTNVQRKNSLSELKVGDIVEINYEKTTKMSKDVAKSKKVVKEVKFLREAPGKDGTLISGKK